MALLSRMPDYSTYSLRDLHGVLDTIDKEEYPDRLSIVRNEFRKKGEERFLTTGLHWYEILPTAARADFPARIAGWIMLLSGLLTSLALIAAGAKGPRPLLIAGVLLLLRPVAGLLLILKRRRMLMLGLIVQLVAIAGAVAATPMLKSAAGANPGPGAMLTVGTVFGVLSLIFLVVAWMRSRALDRYERSRGMLVGGN